MDGVGFSSGLTTLQFILLGLGLCALMCLLCFCCFYCFQGRKSSRKASRAAQFEGSTQDEELLEVEKAVPRGAVSASASNEEEPAQKSWWNSLTGSLPSCSLPSLSCCESGSTTKGKRGVKLAQPTAELAAAAPAASASGAAYTPLSQMSYSQAAPAANYSYAAQAAPAMSYVQAAPAANYSFAAAAPAMSSYAAVPAANFAVAAPAMTSYSQAVSYAAAPAANYAYAAQAEPMAYAPVSYSAQPASYAAQAQAAPVYAAQGYPAFEILDGDHDGVITREEFLRAFQGQA